jgi:superfamily I DNA/RNA helicase
MSDLFPPTPEQSAILAAGAADRTSLMITAMAGCGKTTTLKLLSKVVAKGEPALALAFNKKIAVELEKVFPTNWKVQTMNGLGHGAWSKAIGKRFGVDTDKLGKLFKAVTKDHHIDSKDLPPEAFSYVLSVVRAARSGGLVPKQFSHAHSIIPDTQEGWEVVLDAQMLDYDKALMEIAYEILVRSIKLSYSGEIDYDDQIYMSALFGGVFPKFRNVMVDESQDLSPLNHIQLGKVAVDRLFVCGDPRQAIYAFRGADSASMEKLRQMRQAWVDLPLSLTFRCSQAVVARQQHHAPGFTAASTNAVGAVEKWSGTSEEFPEGKPWTIAEVEAIRPGSIGILCRNNAPLFSCALRILKTGRGVNLMGAELAKGLIALTKKLFPDLTLPVAEAIEVVNLWMDNEVAKLRASGKEERVAIVKDRGECLLAILENADIKVAAGIISTLNTMFDKANVRITLATGHKAKGLEWDTVVHLDPWRVPSKFAKRQAEAGNDTALKQDLNLRYVIETRSRDVLILANLDKFEEA